MFMLSWFSAAYWLLSELVQLSRAYCLETLFLDLDGLTAGFFRHCWTDDSQFSAQILPPGVNSLHLAGHIGKDVPRLEKGLLGLRDADVKGQFQKQR
ncbi:hypothetical protein BDV11DRAFT_152052 [Aspergillus similis]